jgi:two-component system phosphate regulon sensor histidine kinase PhoR
MRTTVSQQSNKKPATNDSAQNWTGKPDSLLKSSNEVEPYAVDKLDMEFFILIMGMIFVLTLSLALLMVPFVFYQRAPEVLEDVWRKGFFGFLILSLLFDIYLIGRQKKLRMLRRQLAKQRSDQDILVSAKKMDEALLQSIGEGVFAVDSRGCLIQFNRRAEDLTGIEARQAISRPYREVLRFEKLPMANFVERAMQLRREVHIGGEAALVRPDGTQVAVSILASPIMEDDSVKGCIVTLRDAREQRALDQMKTEFISLASHQLRTPLTGLRWYASTLAEGQAGGLNPQQQGLMKEIEACIDQMVGLVDDLLDVSRLDQGILALSLAPLSLAEIAADVAKKLESKASEFRVSVVVDDSLASAPSVLGDKRLLTEVFTNLVDNAIKYTPKNGKVKVAAYQEGPDVVVSVTDTGVGISSADAEKLFKKFSRIENPLSNRERGTGLGLYFAKGVVEMHRGRIWVRSIEGKGSTFFVGLPI